MRRQGLLSTGEFARLCHTTKETLYHYAELGLLRPCYVGANDYRYYDVQQYLIFDLICSFKDTEASVTYSPTLRGGGFLLVQDP